MTKKAKGRKGPPVKEPGPKTVPKKAKRRRQPKTAAVANQGVRVGLLLGAAFSRRSENGND